ncbi:exosortase K [Hymenobacter elongatus]|uniref:Exosortase K n=1 Tax=Hymenobacter elongatus TaxID=877208 RepID=A0A4Z0PGC7_9BACT|nr:exosortase K [Hymenobacter elongatus]TGE14186.1 exosortase K [Hymenobacter elongatus]
MSPASRLPLYVAFAAAFLLLKLSYAQATTTDLLWLLRPTDTLVGAVLGSGSSFEPVRGFVHSGLRITIDKSCSGFNFWLLCSGLLLTVGLRYLGPGKARSGWWLLALPVLGYGLTVLVNASRILVAVGLQRAIPTLARRYAWLHEAEGVLVYLFFLLLIYGGFQLLCHHVALRYAKPA